MKISEIITKKYKLRMPPTVYYELLPDVVEAEEEQELILDKIRAEISEIRDSWEKDNYHDEADALALALRIIDKYKAESEDKK